MRHLFNEVCQQTWRLKDLRLQYRKYDLLTPEQEASNTAVTTDLLHRKGKEKADVTQFALAMKAKHCVLCFTSVKTQQKFE